MSAFLTPLDVQLVNDASADGRGTWKLLQSCLYQSDVAGSTIVVPAGFKTDFASVPRLPVVFLAFGGRASRASVVHDWLYSTYLLSKELSDKVFLEAMLITGVPIEIAHEMYTGVYTFGLPHWVAPNSPQIAVITATIQAIKEEAVLPPLTN